MFDLQEAFNEFLSVFWHHQLSGTWKKGLSYVGSIIFVLSDTIAPKLFGFLSFLDSGKHSLHFKHFKTWTLFPSLSNVSTITK